MTEISFVDTTSQIDGMRITPDGYLTGTVNCARIGAQTYLRSELGLMGDGTITVYRPEDAVFSEDSMKTYVGKPVTMHHPKEAVTADNWKDHAIGTVGTRVIRSGEMVQVDIAVMDGSAIKDIQAGTRQISMGYTTPIKIGDGVAADGTEYGAIQTGPIRINHLAVVPRARGGDKLRIGDSADTPWGAVPIETMDHQTQEAKMKITVDGITIDATEQSAQVIDKMQGKITAMQADVAAKDAALATKDGELGAKDATIAAKDAEIKALKDAAPTGAVLDAMVAERATLIATATAVAPTLKCDGMSNAQIKQSVVRSGMGEAVVDTKLSGKVDAYKDAFYDAMFDALTAQVKQTNDSAEAIARIVPTAGISDAAKVENDAYQASVARFKRNK